MKASLYAAVGVVSASLALACHRAPPTPAAVKSACGPALRWSMPTTTIVERSTADSRTLKVLATQARLDAFIRAAEAACYSSGDAYPRTLEALMVLPPAIAKCSLQAHHLTDAWGRPIFYGVFAGQLVVRSAGPDGMFATGDDIGRPSLEDPHVESFDITTECRDS